MRLLEVTQSTVMVITRTDLPKQSDVHVFVGSRASSCLSSDHSTVYTRSTKRATETDCKIRAIEDVGKTRAAIITFPKFTSI